MNRKWMRAVTILQAAWLSKNNTYEDRITRTNYKNRRFLKTFQGWGPRIENVTVKYILWKRRKQCSKKLFYQKESQSLEGGNDSSTDFWDGRRNNIWDGRISRDTVWCFTMYLAAPSEVTSTSWPSSRATDRLAWIITVSLLSTLYNRRNRSATVRPHKGAGLHVYVQHNV